jgi:hypothetical protein
VTCRGAIVGAVLAVVTPGVIVTVVVAVGVITLIQSAGEFVPHL